MSSRSALVERTLRRAVLLPVVGAVIVGAVFLGIIQRLMFESERLLHSEEVIVTAERSRELAVDLESGIRGYLLTHDRRFLAPYDHASATLPNVLQHLKALVADNPEQARRASTIAADIVEWQRFASLVFQSRSVHQPEIAGKLLMDRVRSDHDLFLQAERALSAERTQRVRNATFAAIAATIALALVAGTVVMFFTRRQLRSITVEYEDALTRAEESSLAKDRMLATVSHELRTPLTSILGWSSLLRSQEADRQFTQLALTSIEQSARLQARLVEDLIDISRMVAGKLRVEIADIDLRLVLEATIETMQPAADAKGVVIAPSISADDLKMSGDAARLQQVFWNLLSNAVRFTPAGGKIDIAAFRDAQAILVRVTDTGFGIERDFLPRVFEPFAQQSESGKSSSGLGLGLGIARRVVELHGGIITAKSEGPGRGAEFVVRLPLHAVRDQSEQAATNAA